MMKNSYSPLSPAWNKRITTVLLLFMALSFSVCKTNTKQDKKNDSDTLTPGKTNDERDRSGPGDSSLLTIASITEDPASKRLEIRFYERAAIFSLDPNDKLYAENKDSLAAALRTNVPMKFVLAGGTITRIQKASDEEIRAYNTGDGINSEKMRVAGVKPLPVDIAKIDTSIFDRVDKQVYFPVFRRCTNVVPDYATLVEIFNYCASQGCNNPGPYTIPNCIPFQYVIDGCYARAHKMRQMIAGKYGYCVEKVFSFAEGPPNKLAVKANKWGGCCVEWWYHVVPLLRVNKRVGRFVYQICYVIDPGMFDKPVTLSKWLQAQENTTCNPNANVTSYSIQPGSVYWPLGSSASFGTDPGYVLTEQTLINYKNLITCN